MSLRTATYQLGEKTTRSTVSMYLLSLGKESKAPRGLPALFKTHDLTQDETFMIHAVVRGSQDPETVGL